MVTERSKKGETDIKFTLRKKEIYSFAILFFKILFQSNNRFWLFWRRYGPGRKRIRERTRVFAHFVVFRDCLRSGPTYLLREKGLPIVFPTVLPFCFPNDDTLTIQPAIKFWSLSHFFLTKKVKKRKREDETIKRKGNETQTPLFYL